MCEYAQSFQKASQIHTGSFVFAEWKRQGMLTRVYAMLWKGKHIMCWELHFLHTNRHQNKQAPQLACICKTVLGSTCKLLSEGLVPSYFLFCAWPQSSSHLACLHPITDTRKALVCLPVALRAFWYIIFIISYVPLIVVANVSWLLLSFSMVSCWFLFENPQFFSRTGSNPVETSGDDSVGISDTHHMWFIILRLACPGQIGLCIFSDGPIHIHGTRLWWHIGPMKVFPVFVSQFKEVDGNLRCWCDTGSTLGQSSPPSPAPRKPLSHC